MGDTAQALIQGLKSLTQEQLAAVIAQSKRNLRQQNKKDARALAEAEKRAVAEDEERYLAEEEQAEIDDDPQANESGDTSTNGPASNPGADKRKKQTKRGYWDQSDEDGAGGDSDEDTVVVRPPRAKKARGPQVTIGKPKTVVSRLPQRRGHSRIASTSTVSRTATSSPPRSPPPSSDLPSTPARSGDDTIPTYTPYHEDHSKFTTQGKQSPQSQTLLDTAYHHFRIKIALEEGFPDGTLRTAMAKASFIEACQELNVGRRLVRFNEEQLYAKRMSDSIAERASQLRGEVKTKAQGLVSAQYCLASLSEDEVKAEVTRLLNRSAFHFSDTKNRKGMFENTIIPMIIANQWFKRKSAEGAGQYSQHFNPCPLPLIALVITAVECALSDWKTGLCISTGNHFTYEDYNACYRKHISSLEKYKKKFPVQFAQLQEKTWRDAWRMAGRNPSAATGIDSDLDDDDFEDIRQRGVAGN